ncbi:MAG: TonB-dependent receptor [Flavobacteriales bacterium]|jgi:iron complex outermembrane receptor protein
MRKRLLLATCLLCASALNAQELPSQNLPQIDTLSIVTIEATRANVLSPIAYTELDEQKLAGLNNGQDIPYVLRLTPSLVATSDAGAGVGYTGLWIRGSDPARINVTINGVPLNDPESQQVFWVNTPDLTTSASSIQVQRGIGTSTNGAGSFGGSIRIDTRGLRTSPYLESSNAAGSFGTWKNNLTFGTGLLKSGWILEGRLSQITSDGYIDRASSLLRSYFGELAKYTTKGSVKLTAFGGKEITYQSWNGTPHEVLFGSQQDRLNFASRNSLSETQTQNLLTSGRTYNFYQYENQVDNYAQHHAQAHWNRRLNTLWNLQLTGHYTRGKGYFEEYKEGASLSSYLIDSVATSSGDVLYETDVVRRRWLDNHFGGWVGSLTRKSDQWVSVLGGAFSVYDGLHYGEVIDIPSVEEWRVANGEWRYYEGNSLKLDGNVYWKNTVLLGKRLNAFADIQLRSVSYHTDGTDNNLRAYDVDFNAQFFNPKAGFTFFTEKHKAYVLAAYAGKEPNRNDFVDAVDPTQVKSEFMFDGECGYAFANTKYRAGINAYWMQYKNQLVVTGALNDVGAPVRVNVPESYRRGLEVELGMKLPFGFFAEGNVTWSRNRIAQYDELVYAYTDTSVTQLIFTYTDTPIAFSPGWIGAAQLGWRFEPKSDKRMKYVEFAWALKHVGQQYMDNTGIFERMLPGYFVNDARASMEFSAFDKVFGLDVWVNNALNTAYISNGYTYSYIYGDPVTERFYYPQALRNFMVALRVKF